MRNSNKKEMLKLAQKAGIQKTIKVGNEEKQYILQHPGVREGMKLRGRAKDFNGNIDEEKYFEELMKKVIFLPDGNKTDWDYWELEENASHQVEVLKEANSFLVG